MRDGIHADSTAPAQTDAEGAACDCAVGRFFARRPWLGLLCAMLVLLGVPSFTVAYGGALPMAVQLALIIGAFAAGGLMATVAIALGLIVPQMRFQRECLAPDGGAEAAK